LFSKLKPTIPHEFELLDHSGNKRHTTPKMEIDA